MQGCFDYLYTVSSMGEINVADIGNCVIQASNDIGCFYYLWIKTSNVGITHVLEIGPTTEIVEYMMKSFNMSYRKFNYTDGKCEKAIEGFLNKPGNMTTQAIEITVDILKEKFKDFDIFKFMETADDFNTGN